MQQFLKFGTGTAGTGIVPAELFAEFLVTVHHPVAALYPRLGGETIPALTGALV
jgi:hypothetical protein